MDEIKFLLTDIIEEYVIYYDDDYRFSQEEFVEMYLKNELPRPIDEESAEIIKKLKTK